MTREVFATGIVDITLGRDGLTDETWKRGRVSGFVDGMTAGGTRFTASVDTREDELRDLFRDFGRKHPDQILRNIEADEVWVTTGDDSVVEDLAPTSGKLFVHLEKEGASLTWGDFKPAGDIEHFVRSDPTLYGLTDTWASPGALPNAESRCRFTGYAAQPESLVQRDIFRGTGGSSYVLSRRDIEAGTETLIVEIRDPVSGRVLSAKRLVEGRDYRIDHVPGRDDPDRAAGCLGRGGWVGDRSSAGRP